MTSKANVQIDDQYSESFNIMKGVRRGCPLSQILFNLFINDIFNNFSELGIPLGESRCCGGLFVDDIVLCAPSRTKLKKMLRKVNEWVKFNMMNFGINKCATMMIQPDTPLFQNIFSNVSNSIENNVYIDSSVCEKVFNFLLGGRSINNSTREWEDLFKCQMKSGAYSDTPFLVVTAVLLQSIIPIAIGQQWSFV